MRCLIFRAPKSSRARILNNIGYDYTKFKQLDSAAAYYGRAMELDPGYSFAYYNLSIVQLQKNDTTRFFETIETALTKGYTAGLIPTDSDLKAMLNHPRMMKLLEKYSEE
jgi:tetratricopeptide (TPR) repeat protein